MIKVRKMLASIVNPLLLGISIGSILLISALGLAVIYGAAGVINMAHGEFIMLGAYSTYTLQTALGMPFLLCIPCAFFIVGIIGFAIERSLICYLYNRPLDTLLATWGVSLVLMASTRLIFGSDVKYINMPEFLSTNIELGALNFSTFRLFLIAVALILLFITWFIFYRTKLGIKIRAVTQNKEMAASFGINAAQVYSITFAFGAGLAGAAGAMFGALSIVLPTMGLSYVV
jgi:urea transport system permease protein